VHFSSAKLTAFRVILSAFAVILQLTRYINYFFINLFTYCSRDVHLHIYAKRPWSNALICNVNHPYGMHA